MPDGALQRGQPPSLAHALRRGAVYTEAARGRQGRSLIHGPDRRTGPPAAHALLRRHHHDHLAAFHAWVLLDLGELVEIVAHAHQHVHAEFLMRQLAAAEAHGHLDLVAFLDEFEHAAHLDVVVVVIDAGAQLDLLDLDDLLLLARLVAALLFLVFELAEIEDLDHRRVSIGGDLDEIEACLEGALQGLAARHDADHLAALIDKADARHADLLVDAWTVPGRRHVLG